jgi:hypothetical protein
MKSTKLIPKRSRILVNNKIIKAIDQHPDRPDYISVTTFINHILSTFSIEALSGSGTNNDIKK